MKKKYLIIFIFIFVSLFGQEKSSSIRAGIGIGSFMGDFPSQTTLGTKLLYNFPSPFDPFNSLQINAVLAQEIEKFLPDSYSYDHYSYFTSFAFMGNLSQPLSPNVFIEEELGIVYLNDRSFDDVDVWNLGFAMGVSLGTHLTMNSSLLFNLEYCLTFQNTNVSYSLITILYSYQL